MRKTLIALSILPALASCTSVSYTPPSQAPALANDLVVYRSYDETWDALVAHATQTFFAIDNFERATGLMTLSYGSSEPSRFVDCGIITVSNSQGQYSGPYVDYVTRFNDGSVTGRMNLLVQRVTDYETRVRVTARYILEKPTSFQTVPGFWGPQNITIPGGTFAFDSNGSSTVEVYDATEGEYQPRTCRATGVAENEIIRAVQ